MTKTKTKNSHLIVRAAKAVHRHAKDHFIPHEGNNHVPHVLKHRVLLGYSAVLVLLKALVIAASIALPSSSAYSSAITPRNIIDLTNQARRQSGLAALQMNQQLSQAAQAKAQDMLDRQYFAHDSPGGATPWDWIGQAGYKYTAAGENLAIHFTQAEDVQTGWLASPEHRANILSPKYSEIGVGVAEGMFEKYPSILVVEMFGRPQTTASGAAKPNRIAQPNVPEANAATTTQTARTVQAAKDGAVAGAQAEAPAIDVDSAKVTPQGNGYEVQVPISNASSALIQLGMERAALKPAEASGTWTGFLAYDPELTAASGEALSVTAVSADGQQAGSTLALVAPTARTRDLYAFTQPNAGGEYKLFGLISLSGLNDNVRIFYILSILFLSACLLVSMLIKIRIQKPTIIGHTLIVIGLAVLLWKM